MGAKIFLFFVGIVVVIGLMYGLSHSEAMDRLAEELRTVNSGSEIVGRQIQTQQDQLDLRLEAVALTETLKTKMAEKEKLGAELKEVEAVGPRLVDAMIQAIVKVRDASVGMAFPELALAKGVTLKNVRIQRISEEAVTFQHSEGVTVARVDDLPAELRDRVRLGEAVPKAAVEIVPDSRASSGKLSPEMAAYKEQVKLYQKKGLEMRLAVERLTNEVNTLTLEVAKAEADANSATSATQKFYTRNRRDQLKAQLSALQRNLEAANIEVKRHDATPPEAPALQ